MGALTPVETRPQPHRLPARIGGGAGALLWPTTLVIFLSARDALVNNAHVAALLMFLCIVGAAVDNALDTRRASLRSLDVTLAAAACRPE